jgi:hypothetical protein
MKSKTPKTESFNFAMKKLMSIKDLKKTDKWYGENSDPIVTELVNVNNSIMDAISDHLGEPITDFEQPTEQHYVLGTGHVVDLRDVITESMSEDDKRPWFVTILKATTFSFKVKSTNMFDSMEEAKTFIAEMFAGKKLLLLNLY